MYSLGTEHWKQAVVVLISFEYQFLHNCFQGLRAFTFFLDCGVDIKMREGNSFQKFFLFYVECLGIDWIQNKICVASLVMSSLWASSVEIYLLVFAIISLYSGENISGNLLSFICRKHLKYFFP